MPNVEGKGGGGNSYHQEKTEVEVDFLLLRKCEKISSLGLYSPDISDVL